MFAKQERTSAYSKRYLKGQQSIYRYALGGIAQVWNLQTHLVPIKNRIMTNHRTIAFCYVRKVFLSNERLA